MAYPPALPFCKQIPAYNTRRGFMIIVQKERYDTPHQARIADFVSPDPRHISEAGNVEEGVDIAKRYINETEYKGNVEVLDYTPYTLCSPAKRKFLKMVTLDNNDLCVREHPDA